jgi:hypothetical protein
MAQFRCIYYGHQKDEADRSLEHIWPDGLGGDWAPDFFHTRDVCGRCNNLLGQFVDGEFQRSFFAGVEQSQGALAFIDTAKPRALPLVYMGAFPEAPSDTEICESWLGARGERIFFFHVKDREDFVGFAGGDPMRRGTTDGGRVYLGFSRANLFWVLTAIQSVRKTFKKGEFRLLTGTDSKELGAACAPESQQSEKDRSYIGRLLEQRSAHTRMTMQLDHGMRFQCKLALGFGHALFGPTFAGEEYEQKLRAGLWERDPAKRRELEIIGESMLAGRRDHDEVILGYPGAYTFAFMRSREGVMLWVYAPSTRSLRTGIMPGGENLRSPLFEQFGGGFVVVLAPGLQKHFGPYAVDAYVAHRHGGPRIKDLEGLEASRRSIEEVEQAVAGSDIPQSDVTWLRG